MGYNKETFWDNTQGVAFFLEEQKEFEFAVERCKVIIKELYLLDINDAECNYNQDKTAWFARFEKYAFRVGEKWGILESCYWVLNTQRVEEENVKIALISYGQLRPINW